MQTLEQAIEPKIEKLIAAQKAADEAAARKAEAEQLFLNEAKEWFTNDYLRNTEGVELGEHAENLHARLENDENGKAVQIHFIYKREYYVALDRLIVRGMAGGQPRFGGVQKNPAGIFYAGLSGSYGNYYPTFVEAVATIELWCRFSNS